MVVAGETLVLEPEVCFSYRRHTASASSAACCDGRRLPDERRYYADGAAQMRARGWRRAARTARLRVDQPAARPDAAAPGRSRAVWGSAALLTHAFGLS